MLNLSVDWQWVVGDLDVTEFVESWELSREQPDLDTPAQWRGKVVIRGQGSLDLSPLTNPRWRPGTPAKLWIAGSLLFTGQVVLPYHNDWDPIPLLELEVADVLAARNRRQVFPLAEYSPKTLLEQVEIGGEIPDQPVVEVSTDLDSPVRIAQQLTWVGSLIRSQRPAVLYTRPDGTVGTVTPETDPSLTRDPDEVIDATRVKPGLEIPGRVVASTTLRGFVRRGPSARSREQEFFVATASTLKITRIDSLGRVVREEVLRGGGRDSLTLFFYEGGERERFYRITRLQYVAGFGLWEYEVEEGRTAGGLYPLEPGAREWLQQLAALQLAVKTRAILWPARRLGFNNLGSLLLTTYLQSEIFYRTADQVFLVIRSSFRARGTIEEGLPLEEARQLVNVSTEVQPGEYQPPTWARPATFSAQSFPLSAEVEVAGWNGPPLYLSVPWLTNLWIPEATEVLQAAARWMATEIAGRAYGRQIAMPVPPEWLSDPRPWRMLRLGNEALWLVGERLTGDRVGVRFAALGILASPPGILPSGGDSLPSLVPFSLPGRPTVGVAVSLLLGADDPPALLVSLGLAVEMAQGVKGSEVGIGALLEMGISDPGVGIGALLDVVVESGGGGTGFLILQAENADFYTGQEEDYLGVTGILGSDLGWFVAFGSTDPLHVRIRYSSDSATNGAVVVGIGTELFGSYYSLPPTGGDLDFYDLVLSFPGIENGITLLELDFDDPIFVDAVAIVNDDYLYNDQGWPNFP